MGTWLLSRAPVPGSRPSPNNATGGEGRAPHNREHRAMEGRDMGYVIGFGAGAALYLAIWARNVQQTRRGLR